jgi:hypothetical protein
MSQPDGVGAKGGEDLFAGEKVDMPWADPTGFRRPAKEAAPDTQGKLI